MIKFSEESGNVARQLSPFASHGEKIIVPLTMLIVDFEDALEKTREISSSNSWKFDFSDFPTEISTSKIMLLLAVNNYVCFNQW